ncbi:MAG TPA: PAS domain-containing sensor histidine kinase [Bacteroidales bacterium]|nr:PAS domain-containing sensor histidine kinase [Bacteroidales bacterium]
MKNKATGRLIKDDSPLLNENDELCSIIFNSIDIGIKIFDKTGRIIRVNPWWIEKTGFSEYELVHMTLDDITSVEFRDKNPHLLKQLACGEIEKTRITKKYIKKDGNYFWGELAITPLKQISYNEDGLFAGVVSDITASVNIENIISEKNIELENLISERNRFISILAHDLKNPFNALLGFSDLILENIRAYDIEKIENQLELINHTVHQTFNLFNDIIAWGKIQTGRLSFNPVKTNLNDICRNTCKILRLNAEYKQIIISQQFHRDLNIYADREMIKSVLRNLISNSLRYTGTKGIINIASYESGHGDQPQSVKDFLDAHPAHIIISVSDNGIGIEPVRLSSLFSLSSKHIPVSADERHGAGIGLLLCKDFIGRHGGRIWAESTYGKGSTFYFSVRDADKLY